MGLLSTLTCQVHWELPVGAGSKPNEEPPSVIYTSLWMTLIKTLQGVSDREIEAVSSPLGEEFCLSPACPHMQSPWAPGDQSWSSLVCLRQAGCSQLPPLQLSLGSPNSAWTKFPLLTRRLLPSATAGFCLSVIFNKKWLQQHGVRLMCPQKQTWLPSGSVLFHGFWKAPSLSSPPPWASGWHWFHSSGISIWSRLRKQSWLKDS